MVLSQNRWNLYIIYLWFYVWCFINMEKFYCTSTSATSVYTFKKVSDESATGGRIKFWEFILKINSFFNFAIVWGLLVSDPITWWTCFGHRSAKEYGLKIWNGGQNRLTKLCDLSYYTTRLLSLGSNQSSDVWE